MAGHRYDSVIKNDLAELIDKFGIVAVQRELSELAKRDINCNNGNHDWIVVHCVQSLDKYECQRAGCKAVKWD